MDAAVAGLIGVAIGAISGLLAPIINVQVSEKLWSRERKAEKEKWLRERLQEIYSSSIDCLTDSPMNCNEAKKWLNLILIYHSSRDSIEYLDFYGRVLNLSDQSPIWMAKELTATVIEMAASDKRLMGEHRPSEHSTAYWISLGKIFLDRLRYIDAESCFRKAIEINSHYAPAYYYIGQIHFIYNRYAEAIKCYDKAIENNPRCHEAMNSKSEVYIQLEMYAEAEESANAAIEIDPKYAIAHYNLHIALNKLERSNEADRAFDKAIELDPNLGISG